MAVYQHAQLGWSVPSTPAFTGRPLEQSTMQPTPNRLAATRLAALIGLAAWALSSPAVAHDGVATKLDGYDEVPSVASAATGRFKAVVHKTHGSISYEMSYSGLEGDVRQAHIHLGQRRANGGVMVFLCQTTFNPDPTGLAPTCPQSGTVSGTLTAANVIGPAGQGVDPAEFGELVAAIRAGVAYANVHSTKFPSGEVRGQLRDESD
jgi:hypothetical protein